MSSIHEMRHPNDKVAGKVEALSAAGYNQKAICDYLEMDQKTLRKHYKKELDTALMERTMKVAEALFQKATVGDNVTAQIFWLKCQARGGWIEAGEELEELKNKAVGKIKIEVIGAETPKAESEEDNSDTVQ